MKTDTEIEKRLMKIFRNTFGIPDHFWDENLRTTNLLAREIYFLPSFVLKLFFCVEQEFAITIPEDEVVNRRFNSFDNICTIVQKQLAKKSAIDNNK